MIIELNEQTISKIKNPTFFSYASMYLDIYDRFTTQIQNVGLDIDNDFSDEVNKLEANLKHKGAVFRNDGKSIYVNHISPSCIACQKGIGSMTFFISLQC
ncbi:MAG: radical SAM protein, partial [Bacillota bacterium]|nr:radical SAM protein [Bacillota bacterium]